MLAGPVLAAAAGVGATFSATLSPGTLTYGGHATYAIHVQAGAQPASVEISPEGGRWGDSRVVGTPLRFFHARLAGPGSLTASAAGGVALLAGTCLRGRLPGGGVQLDLPANAATTLLWDVALAAPPWPGARYAPGFLATGPVVPAPAGPGAVGESVPTVRVAAPPPHVRGPWGVHVRLRVRPRPRRDDTTPFGRLPPGRRITILGRTDPAARGVRVRVGYRSYRVRSPRGTTLGHIATVRTGRHGRFRIRGWRPPAHSVVELLTHVPHPGHRLLPDRGCGMTLETDGK